jgi:DMSO reductase anchor subunit
VPSPAITGPTTRYVSRKPLPGALRSADAGALRIQPAHWPLVLLLVGTQLSLGLLLAAAFGGSQISNLKSQIHAASAALFAAALAASVAHLGQPLRAWRVFLGLRRSWLSREAVVLGAAFPLVALSAALPWLPVVPLPPALLDPLLQNSRELGLAAAALSALGVFCSALLYIDTRRHFWRASNTATRMAGTVLVSALAFTWPAAAALFLAVKLALEHALLLRSPISARLHTGPLLGPARLRYGSAALAVLLFAASLPLAAFLAFISGELAERLLFFRAVDSPKMPGLPG